MQIAVPPPLRLRSGQTSCIVCSSGSEVDHLHSGVSCGSYPRCRASQALPFIGFDVCEAVIFGGGFFLSRERKIVY